MEDTDRRHSLPGDTEANFQPKAGGRRWGAHLRLDEGSGHDLVLFLDYAEGQTGDSGWMLELAIDPDGSIVGQITAHPGYDALAVFCCTRDRLSVWDNWGGPEHIIGGNVPVTVLNPPTGEEYSIVLYPYEQKARVHRDSPNGPVVHETCTANEALAWAQKEPK